MTQKLVHEAHVSNSRLDTLSRPERLKNPSRQPPRMILGMEQTLCQRRSSCLSFQ